jgi:hypothetical protein
MNRASLIALVAGSLVGSGCGPESQPPPVTTDSVYVDPVTPTSAVAGYAWDPEAFFINVQNCGGAACPIPAMLSEAIPLFMTAVVQGATVMAIDPLAGAPTGAPQQSGPDGTWRIEGVPGRKDVPYFIVTAGTGTLGELPPGFPAPPLPPVAPANYVPTMTARPIFATSAGCYFQEAAHASDNGVLEAVARYRTAKGQPTTVADLLNPEKFAAVSVFWLYAPALLPSLLSPADHTTLEVSAGSKYHIDWAQPESLPDVQQSTRGFYVKEGTDSSPIGVTAVVVPAGPAAPAEVTYTPVDTVVAAEIGRPYQFFPMPLPAIPGQVSVASLQLFSGFPPPEDVSGAPPAFFCLF